MDRPSTESEHTAGAGSQAVAQSAIDDVDDAIHRELVRVVVISVLLFAVVIWALSVATPAIAVGSVVLVAVPLKQSIRKYYALTETKAGLLEEVDAKELSGASE